MRAWLNDNDEGDWSDLECRRECEGDEDGAEGGLYSKGGVIQVVGLARKSKLEVLVGWKLKMLMEPLELPTAV